MHPKKKKTYQNGGMAALMKMMQGGMLEMPGGGKVPEYPGGGMMPRKRNVMYAEEGNIIERRRREKELEAGGQRVPEGLDRGGVYYDPEAGSFYRVGTSSDGSTVGVPMTGMVGGEAGRLLSLIAEQAEQRGSLDRPENVFGFVTKGDTNQVRGADDPLLQLISAGNIEGNPEFANVSGYQTMSQNPYAYASMVAENPEVGSRPGLTSQGFKSSIKKILGEAMRANDVEKVNQIMGAIMNPEFADLIPGLSPMSYEGTGFMPYYGISGGSPDRRLSTVENLRVEPQDEDQRRSPGSLPR